MRLTVHELKPVLIEIADGRRRADASAKRKITLGRTLQEQKSSNGPRCSECIKVIGYSLLRYTGIRYRVTSTLLERLRKNTFV